MQRQIVAYLKAAGWSVWQTSQGHKHPSGAKGLRITAGIPDLYCLHRSKGAMWLECKRPMKRDLSPAQIDFLRRHVEAAEGSLIRGPSAPTVPPVWTVTGIGDVRAILAKIGVTPEAAHA